MEKSSARCPPPEQTVDQTAASLSAEPAPHVCLAPEGHQMPPHQAMLPSEHYPMLFSPIRVDSLTLANRATISPMTRARAHPDGTATDQMLEYYRRYARGVFDLVTPQGTYTDTAIPRAAQANADWPPRMAEGRARHDFDPDMLQPLATLDSQVDWERGRADIFEPLHESV